MTLTFNPSLTRVKVDPYAKIQGQRSIDSNRKARTEPQTHKLFVKDIIVTNIVTVLGFLHYTLRNKNNVELVFSLKIH